MPTILLVAVIVLLLAVLALQVLLLQRKLSIDLSPVEKCFQAVEKTHERTERSVRDEIAKNRDEASTTARQSREELGNSLKGFGDTLHQQLSTLTQSNEQRLEAMRKTVEEQLQLLQDENTKKLDQVRLDAAATAKTQREESSGRLKAFGESIVSNIGEIGKLQKSQLDIFSERLEKLTQSNDEKLGTMRDTIEQRLNLLQEGNGNKLDQMRQEAAAGTQKTREEVNSSLKTFTDSLVKTITELGGSQRSQLGNVVEQLTKLTESNEKKLDALKDTVEAKLKTLQDDNAKSLEQMRVTVDEKLQGTLDKRLGESFKLVSDRLEQVHKGLGEMQTLATGVGDLKKVLTNVKSRGTWGEVQLGAMLEQFLTPEQYGKNVATKDAGDRVEFAIKFPGPSEDKNEPLWLPIDAKFPTEDYQRLVEAQDSADPEAVEVAAKELEKRIKGCAWDICEKYVNPPKTTDFAILFLPTEGLFAEVVRRIGLTEYVQRECKVMVAGPTTLWSILNSLQMGFRTLAIQQRSSEVNTLLAAVKNEWGKYGEMLGKVQKKLQEASNTIDDAAKRTKAIGRKLRDVQELPAAEAKVVLMLEGADGASEVGEG